MKRLMVTLVVLAFSSKLPAQDLESAKLEKYTSTKGKYVASFPGKVATQQRTTKSELGDIVINLDVVAFGQTGAFIVSYNDYPDAVKGTDPNKLLEGVRTGVKGADGEIVKDEEIKFGPDKLPARMVTIKKPGGLFMKDLMVMKGTRLYQVMVVGTDKTINHAKIDEFFKSFAITK